MGVAAAVGVVGGCGEPAATQVQKPAVGGGTRKRLDTFKEKAQEALSKKNNR
jgi:hypothetical protein